MGLGTDHDHLNRFIGTSRVFAICVLHPLRGVSMKLKILLTIAAIYMGLVGLGVIFAPKAFGVGAVPADASDALIAHLRLWGSPLLGIAVLNWMARNAEPSKARSAIIVGNIVGFAAMTALDAWSALGGGRAVTKVFVFVHLLFAVAFIWVGRVSVSAVGKTS
jgi:hypothetical protein